MQKHRFSTQLQNWRRIHRRAADWFAGAFCVLCEVEADWLCQQCASELTPVRRLLPGGQIAICAGGTDRRLVQAVSLWKDSGVRSLTAPFAQMLTAAALKHFPQATCCATLPPRRSSDQVRGWQPTSELAGELSAKSGLPLVQALEWRHEPRDQRGLTQLQRFENVQMAMVARSAQPRLLLIDDVLTSGASTTEAVRAVVAAGGSVAGVLVLVASR